MPLNKKPPVPMRCIQTEPPSEWGKRERYVLKMLCCEGDFMPTIVVVEAIDCIYSVQLTISIVNRYAVWENTCGSCRFELEARVKQP